MPRADDPALTATRGLAAFWVFIYHVWLSAGPQKLLVPLGAVTLDLTPLASAGWAGVDVFFVLSGFLLWGVFDDWAAHRHSAPSLASFAKRRAMRILPPYYAQVVALALIGWVVPWVEAPTLTALALNLTLTHGWSFEHFQAVNNVWWTLSTEAQFYVVLPLLAVAVRHFGWFAVLCGGVITMLAWRTGMFALFSHAPVIERVWIIEQLPGRIEQFLFGMFASHLARGGNLRAEAIKASLVARPALRRCLAGVAPVVLVALAYRLHLDDFFLRYWAGHAWLYVWHALAASAVAVSLYALAIRPGARDGKSMSWACRPIVALGVVSYSFYLWHELLLRWLSVWVKSAFGAATPAALGVNFAIGLPIAIAMAMLWYGLFERPFLRSRGRLRSVPTPLAPVASQAGRPS